jgi:hypothetical protein
MRDSLQICLRGAKQGDALVEGEPGTFCPIRRNVSHDHNQFRMLLESSRDGPKIIIRRQEIVVDKGDNISRSSG